MVQKYFCLSKELTWAFFLVREDKYFKIDQVTILKIINFSYKKLNVKNLVWLNIVKIYLFYSHKNVRIT